MLNEKDPLGTGRRKRSEGKEDYQYAGSSEVCIKHLQWWSMMLPAMICCRKTVGVLGDCGACSAGERRRSGKTHGRRVRKYKLVLSSPWCRVRLSIWCSCCLCWSVGGMVENKSLLAEYLWVGRWCACRLGCHQDRAVWRYAGSKAGCTHGRHWHVCIVRSRYAMLRHSRMERHYGLPIH